MAKTISLMAGFKDLGKNGVTKGAIRVQCEDLIFDPNDRAAAQLAADALLDVIKSNLIEGKAPDGQALPGLSPHTIARREVEAAQGSRSGEASERYKDPAFRAQVAKNYRKDYAAPRGTPGSFTPVSEHPRGEVSGLLIDSMSARGDRNGKGVAAKRGRPRPSQTGRKPEAQSALESVLAGAPLVTPTVMKAPKIRKALGEILSGIIGKPADIRRNLIKLLKQMKHSAEELQGLADEVDDGG